MFAYLGLTFIHHKTQKGRLKPIITWFQTTFSHIPSTRYDAV
ncbi:phosphoribosylaminoimidazole carboxylase catalytic subunit [Morococcus cerebrosus]|uniref:Phosphoribosylaminoimidazole carboxylase catalytic subunit n=1 Tax=Morococcus cerebrosus TaxID=1056807 RepID=A0A0C1ECE9_9NEIS|nr:phosphoribosylaminoimidazole carboxylase catalytic subunit [Morococcus cerebrosus]